MKKIIFAAAVVLATSVAGYSQAFSAGDLVISTTQFTGAVNASGNPLQIGDALPISPSATAVASGSTYSVFDNSKVDANFGVLSPLSIDEINPDTGAILQSLNVTAATGAYTSFSSKSEGALGLSPDGTAVTFMDYMGTTGTGALAAGQLDHSNANTPGVIDSTNSDLAAPTYRGVIQLNADGSFNATPTNAYSGNNGRAAILINGNYFMVGNAGNSGNSITGTGLSILSDNTGVQAIQAGSSNASTTPIGVINGVYGSSTGYQRGFTLASVTGTADKTGKDDNFRAITSFGGDLYIDKGSGSNGVDTVYKVAMGGNFSLSNTNVTISILPGFSTVPAKGTPQMYPFGLWFANSTTLYVADEGSGANPVGSGTAETLAAADTTGGLQKWSLIGSGTSAVWSLDYTLKTGLITGHEYSVPGYMTGQNSFVNTSGSTVNLGDWAPITDGIRNITGKVNGDGTVTIFGCTSTVSHSGDQGADPNMLVDITDSLSNTDSSVASTETFNTLESATNGLIYRGVAIAPTQAVPEPGTWGMLFGGAGLLAAAQRIRRKSS